MTGSVIQLLILEDDRVDAELYERLLSKIKGYVFETTVASRGLDALQLIDNQPPDLIIADFLLPDMTGVEFIRQLKQRHDLDSLPLIMVTGHGNEEVVVQALQMGAKDYLVKESLNRNGLHRSVHNALEHAIVCRQLISKKEEMEHFISRSSHDLRSPVSQMVTLSNLLLKKYSNGSSDDSFLQHLELLSDVAHNSLSLIDTLSEYAHAGRNSRRFQTISSNRIINNVLKNLQGDIQQAQAQVHIEALPEVYGDMVSLQQLVQNIISNSLKYRKRDLPPLLTISAEETVDEVRIEISDNGIGCPQGKVGEIFEPFVRLHTEEVSGHGVGLATCVKIVQQHEGKIWATSGVDKGMTVYFTLAKNKMKPLDG